MFKASSLPRLMPPNLPTSFPCFEEGFENSGAFAGNSSPCIPSMLCRPPLLLYPFRFFDPARRRWIRARYVVERYVIESSYAQWEIIGPPEIRSGSATMFSPSAALKPLTNRRAHLPPIDEPPVEQPSIDR